MPTEHLVKGQTHYMERQQACFDKERERERESASSGKPKAADRVSSVTHKSRLNREQAKGLELYDVCSVRERDPTIIFL